MAAGAWTFRRSDPTETGAICTGSTGTSSMTADAMNCQWNFSEKILEKGADYCLALKSNQDRAGREVIRLFSTTHPDQIGEYTDQTDPAHNRIEE